MVKMTPEAVKIRIRLMNEEFSLLKRQEMVKALYFDILEHLSDLNNVNTMSDSQIVQLARLTLEAEHFSIE